MKKRVIGGTGFVVLYVVLLFSLLYPLMFLLFAIIGGVETYGIIKGKAKKQYGIFYYLIFVLGIIAMWRLTTISSGFMLYVTILIMYSDTFAYFVGRKFGKHHFSKVSPNKTIEGVIGGIIGGIIAANLTMFVSKLLVQALNGAEFLIWNFSNIEQYVIFDNGLVIILISTLLVILGVMGDLLESKVKRFYQVKDSGTIVYGHGGLLDRLDSWVVATLVLFILLTLF